MVFFSQMSKGAFTLNKKAAKKAISKASYFMQSADCWFHLFMPDMELESDWQCFLL